MGNRRMRLSQLLTLLCFVVWCDACNVTETRDCKSSRAANTVNGIVRGFVRSVGLSAPVETFWGIPYGDPPLGELRFRQPRAFSSNWTGIREATRLGSMCPQFTLTETGNFYAGSEDCLFLNVYRPESINETSSLPVYVFIHGGGYTMGDGFQEGLYDGAHMATDFNMVVVTMNYRMSAIGFFALDSLCEEDSHGSCGNYGLQDQRMALRWVQNNIHNFGGDPTQVTVAGESAGAFSVIWHLASPLSTDLFHRAVVESGTSDVSWFFQSMDDATHFYKDFATFLGCGSNVTDQLACLRALDVSKFVIPLIPMIENMIAARHNKSLPFNIPFASPLFPLMPFGPVIDGSPDGLLAKPADLAAKGQFQKVPLLIGANKNDGSIFEPSAAAIVPGFRFPASDAGFQSALDWFLGDPNNVTTASNLYSDYEFRSVDKLRNDVRLAHIIRDVVFMCSNRKFASSWAKYGVDVFVYTFAYELGELDDKTHLGDFHSSELAFVFQNWIPEISAIVPGAKDISKSMSLWWANFARYGNPNTDPSVPDWPQFTLDGRQFYSLRTQPLVNNIQADNVYPNDEFPSDQKCDFWDQQLLPWHYNRPAFLDYLPFHTPSAQTH